MIMKELKLLASFFVLLVIGAAVPFNQGCSTSATDTAYKAEAVGLVTLQGAATAYKAFKATSTNAVTAAQDAQAHKLFADAKAAEIAAIDASTALVDLGTNAPAGASSAAQAAATQALSDLVTFLTALGIKL